MQARPSRLRASRPNKIRQLITGTATFQAGFWADFAPGTPSTLLSHPVYVASDFRSSITSGSNDDVLLFGDIAKCYTIVDRMGLEVGVNNWVLGSNRRPTGESQIVAFWRTGAGVVTSNAGKLLRL